MKGLTVVFGVLVTCTASCSRAATDGEATTSTVVAPGTDIQLPPTVDVTPYDIGVQLFTDVYVAQEGSDDNTGLSPDRAWATLTRAWAALDELGAGRTPIRINISSGTYGPDEIPTYWESVYGSAENPIVIQGPIDRSAVLHAAVSAFDLRHVHFASLAIAPVGGGDAFHCELCNHTLLRNVELDGGSRETGAQETLKVNQSQYFFVEGSSIHGAEENAVDFVAVQYGHIIDSDIYGAQDWCAYVKGGSAIIGVVGNRIHDCGTGGFTAGQGTGVQFMVAPYVQYEAYGVLIADNVVYDTFGAAFGVSGGFNIVVDHNLAYRVGERSHLIEVVHGWRGCDGGAIGSCQPVLENGGWGTLGEEEQFIPNKNVYIINNLIYNPNGHQSTWAQFAIAGKAVPPSDSTVPSPSSADDNLVIASNVIWNGPADHPILDEGGGCAETNPTCNLAQLTRDNAINTVEPGVENLGEEPYASDDGWDWPLERYPRPELIW